MARSHLMSDSKIITLWEFFLLSKTMKVLHNIFITKPNYTNTCYFSTQSFRTVGLNQRQYFPTQGLFAMFEDIFDCHNEGKGATGILWCMREPSPAMLVSSATYLPSFIGLLNIYAQGISMRRTNGEYGTTADLSKFTVHRNEHISTFVIIIHGTYRDI